MANTTPLHIAVEKGNLKMIEMLLNDSRIDPTIQDSILDNLSLIIFEWYIFNDLIIQYLWKTPAELMQTIKIKQIFNKYHQ